MTRVRAGSMKRTLVEAIIDIEICGHCQGHEPRISSLSVWSKAKVEVLDPWEMTSQIKAKGMYEFHQDLPIRTITRDVAIPICARCLTEHMLKDRQWKGE